MIGTLDDHISEAEYMDDGGDYVDHATSLPDMSKPSKDGLYLCTVCKDYKEEGDFYKDSRVPCGIRSSCKHCYNKKRRRGSEDNSV